MELSRLFENLNAKIIGNSQVSLKGVSANSKAITEGELFIAKSGSNHQGADFICEAKKKGATALLCDQYYSQYAELTQVIVDNPGSYESEIARRFYQDPSQKLWMIGITGTNGKTSCSYLIRQLLGVKTCGLIGTIAYLFKEHSLDATLTTPDAISNQKMLGEMFQSGLTSVVMEVTSIALTQNRCDFIDYDIALFTNFTQDHLDYHKTMGAYLEAKALLFTRLGKEKLAIVNIDDPASIQLTKDCKASIKTYGQSPKASYQIKEIELFNDHTRFKLVFNGHTQKVKSPLIGLYNVYNLTAAIAVAMESGVEQKIVFERLLNICAPIGRLEKIENNLKAQIFVDFAHTPDALKNVLSTIKKTPHRRLITVFGCGGGRDPTKRPLMGQIATDFSDITIITSDNPRNENPEMICEQVYQGCDQTKQIIIEADRKKAILKALQIIKQDDILIIAGRGHEKHQEIGGQKIPFQDAQVVVELLKEKVYG